MLKRLNILLNAIFSLAFCIHMSFIGHQTLFPEVPEIVVYKKDLSKVTFPILFRICLFENKDKAERFAKYGYKDINGYFLGVNKYNSSIVGWKGHSINGSAAWSVEGNVDIPIYVDYDLYYNCRACGPVQGSHPSQPHRS